MRNFNILLFTVIFSGLYFLSSFNGYGQTTSLSYKAKGKSTYGVEITFANASGNVDLQPSEYFNNSEIYFVLKPTNNSPRNYLREDDANEILSQIAIDQGQNKINQSSTPRFLLNSSSKIDRVIISYSKNELEEYNTFLFSVGGFFSEKLKIEEQFFLSFEPQKNIYQRGKSNVDKNEFLNAYNDFIKVVENANKNLEIQSFSFYTPILTVEIPNTIESFISTELEKFNEANLRFNKTKNIITLNSCDSIVKLTSTNIEVFNSYFLLDKVNTTDSKDKILAFINTLTEQNNKNFNAFEEEKMLFFKQKTYQDYQFELFIDLISKMLLYKNSLSFIDKLEPIDINLIKNFPESKRELLGDWGDQFKIFISLINKNIEQSGIIFKKDVMDNLLDLSSTQKQPYYEIISAFNSLNTDTDSFKDNLHTALTKSSNETILDYIEYWLLSFRLTVEGINSAYITQLNEGINLIQREQYDKANDVFNLLMRIANQYAPVWYYSGQIKHGLGESYSAERFFKKALEIYPDYMAPRKFILKIFENDESYTQLIENTNTAIEKMNTWYFHYKRAMANYYLKNYDETIKEINKDCMKLNPWDINQYFLLGDAYLALKDFENAKLAFEKTLDINPFSSDSKSFDDRMKMLYKKMEETGKKKIAKKEVVEKEVIEEKVVEEAVENTEEIK